MLDRKILNKKYKTAKFLIEKERLVLFAKATGQTDPIYFDETLAREKGFPSILAPPTFLTTVGYEQEDSYQYLNDLSVDLGDVLHAGQIYKYHSLVFAGDVITMDSKIIDMYDKKNGSLEFVEFESLYTNQNGKLVLESLSTLVIR